MGRPIKLTKDLKEMVIKEIIEELSTKKMFDGKINYSKTFKYSTAEGDDKAYITFTPIAFAKMVMLLHKFDSEVAWHGVAYRSKDNENYFNITDILVYPQLVSGATVNTDQEEYTNWLYSQPDEVFENIRMQGHSHVGFSTTPSGVDTTHQAQILEQLDDDMFYIFMIWNKKLEKTIKIFDLKHNTLYENDDVEVFIGNNDVDLDAFIKDAKEIVKPKYQIGNTYNQNKDKQVKDVKPVTPVSSTPTTNKPVPVTSAKSDKKDFKQKDKPTIGKGWAGANARNNDDVEDEWERYYRYGYYSDNYYD